MNERQIGRNVLSRDRFSRLFSLGDRNSPLSWAPGLILGEDDPELPISIAPLFCSSRKQNLPQTMKISTRGNLCFPFDSVDSWDMNPGLTLPPSLVESDSGDFGLGHEALPISWNSLHHDGSLLELQYQPSLIVITDSPQLSSNSGLLEEAIITIRTNFPASLIWTPGIAGPDNCALLAWMGVDIFDMARSRQASSLGLLLTESGPRKIDPTTNEDPSMESQAKHWVNAISSTRSAIREGSLRELAERQSTSSPRSVERLRRHDKISNLFSKRMGISRSTVDAEKILRCHSYESRNDVEIRIWRDKISDTYEPPSHNKDVLVLLPCSAKKPYKLSKSHARFRRSIKDQRAHEVMVTAPLGLVPRELEDLWPAAHYDIPVTGDWDSDEIATILQMLKKLVNRVGYSFVINHSGLDLSLENSEVIDTRMGDSAGSNEALERLGSAIDSAFKSIPRMEYETRFRDEAIKSVSRHYYGSDKWLEGCVIRGRPPILTIFRNDVQVAKWNPRRGSFSLSKSSLETMHKLRILKCVELTKDAEWIGDIFPNIIDSFDPTIISGDEILVIQDGNLIGSARAIAPGWEWPHGPGRLAKSRHRL